MKQADGPDPDSAPGQLDGGRWETILVRCEEIFFLLVLSALILAGLLPIIARYLGLASASWAGPLSRQLVLWVALFGAGAATRDRRHISVDAVSQFLPRRGRVALRAFTEIVAAVICAVLVTVSFLFVREEIEVSGDVPSPLGVPLGWLPAVIPVGFALLTLRLSIAAWSDGRTALSLLVPPRFGRRAAPGRPRGRGET